MSAFEVMLFVVGLAVLWVGVVCLVVGIERANRGHYDE